MKSLAIFIPLCIVLCLLVAGCTTTQPPPVATQTPTLPVPSTMNTPPGPVVDPDLLGTWTIREIGMQGGSAPLDILNARITATFDEAGHVGGNGGCNGYGADYTLAGRSDAFGKGISISPVISTLMYCEGTSSIEAVYFQILQNATSYVVISNQTLSVRDNLGSVLVYTR
ncbi:MAG: META domain-containing protein [Methanoregulaceae archaeon]|nr:META domain-containing protein [Methanoregulaceae archaeon]